MPIPLVSDVYTAARAVIGDTVLTSGEVFNNALLQPHYQFAYAELFRALQNAQNPRVRQESYYNVPINTGYLNPATAFITNLGEIESVEERGSVTAWAVSSFTPGAGLATVVSAATTLIAGNQAVLYGVTGVTDDANGIWTVTPNSSTSTQLDGCVAVASGTPTGGTLSFSAENFLPMRPQSRIDWIDKSPASTFGTYAWEGDVLRFPPASGVVQLRIVYTLSGSAPTITTASTGIDDCLGFLAYRIAGLAVLSKGMVQRAETYRNMSVGPNWESTQMPGGILNQLLQPGVRNMQRLPPSQRRPPPYNRNRRLRGMCW